jgi:hypothetical protein
MPNSGFDIWHSTFGIDGVRRRARSYLPASFAPAAGFAFAASTSFLIFSRRRTTRFRLIWCLDLSPFNLDIR